jgi:hypothetical protein
VGRLRGSRSGCALAQLAPRCLTGPGARIDLAHQRQPFLRLGLRGEVAHVQAKALAAFLEAAADEELETLQLGELDLRQRHGRGGGTQIQYERTAGWRRRVPGCHARASVGSDVGYCCHNFPDQNHEATRSAG